MDGQQQLGMIEMQTRYRMSSAGGRGGGRDPAVWNCQIYLHVWLAAACRYHFQTRCVSFTPVYWGPCILYICMRMCTGPAPCVSMKSCPVPSIPICEQFEPMFWIHDIFERVQIRGSVILTYGSRSCSGSGIIRQWPSRCQQKIFIFSKYFCLLLFDGTFTSSFEDKKRRKKLRIGIREDQKYTDPDPNPQHWFESQ